MASKNKSEYIRVGQLLKSKNGKSMYLSFNCAPAAPPKVKKLVKGIEAALQELGISVITFSKTDDEFREKFNVPKFVIGNLSAALESSSRNEDDSEDEKPAKKSSSKRVEEDEDDGF